MSLQFILLALLVLCITKTSLSLDIMNPDSDSPNTGESQYLPYGTQYPSGGRFVTAAASGTRGGGWGNVGPNFGTFAGGNQFPTGFIQVPLGFGAGSSSLWGMSGNVGGNASPCRPRPVTLQSPVYPPNM